MAIIITTSVAIALATEPPTKLEPRFKLEDSGSTSPIVTFTATKVLDVNAYQPTELTIRCGDDFIRIDLRTGAVRIPKGVENDGAAKEFWHAVAAAFPDVRKAIIAGDRKP